MMNSPDNRLRGCLILLIDGDPFQASYIAEAITSAGGQVLGPARSEEEASGLIASLRSPPAATVVSIEIFESWLFDQAHTLLELAIPLLLVSRRPRDVMPGRDMLAAPFASYQVVNHLCAKLGCAETA